ncbi:hypothetical protein MMPV_006655 [Pyropia vietnamensis]
MAGGGLWGGVLVVTARAADADVDILDFNATGKAGVAVVGGGSGDRGGGADADVGTHTVVVVEVTAERAFRAPSGQLCQHLPGERGLLRRLWRDAGARYGSDAVQVLFKLPALRLGVRPRTPARRVGVHARGGALSPPPPFPNTPILVGRLAITTTTTTTTTAAATGTPSAAAAVGVSSDGAVAAAAAATASVAATAVLSRLRAEWAAGLAFGGAPPPDRRAGWVAAFAPPPPALPDHFGVVPTATGVRVVFYSTAGEGDNGGGGARACHS